MTMHRRISLRIVVTSLMGVAAVLTLAASALWASGDTSSLVTSDATDWAQRTGRVPNTIAYGIFLRTALGVPGGPRSRAGTAYVRRALVPAESACQANPSTSSDLTEDTNAVLSLVEEFGAAVKPLDILAKQIHEAKADPVLHDSHGLTRAAHDRLDRLQGQYNDAVLSFIRNTSRTLPPKVALTLRQYISGPLSDRITFASQTT